MRVRKRLWVEVVAARNLESRQALDAYCVLQLLCATGGNGAGDTASPLPPSRSLSAQSSGSSASWPHAADFALEAGEVDASVLVQLFTEKSFFFDMFPASSSRGDGSSAGDSSSDSGGDSADDLDADAPEHLLADASATIETDSEDGDDERECASTPEQKVHCDLQVVPCFTDKQLSSPANGSKPQTKSPRVTTSSAAAAAAASDAADGSDELLGFLELSTARFCKPSRVATDAWYRLRGTQSGEVRVRTLCVDDSPDLDADRDDGDAASRAAVMRESLRRSYLYEGAMRDLYGFKIPESARAEWAHLRSYEDCREEQRIRDWESAFGTQFFSLYPAAAARESGVVRQLTRAGVPRSWRERVYMNISGAREKQQNAGVDYYTSLVEQSETTDSTAFRQIELDIDRTFGHSGTKICSDAGRAVLRRVLRAYSLRNASVGYCQGLNFIVGFLTLAAGEEAAFWLLAVICEDLYPGYYTPTMAETQTDMLVLKELISDELPELDAFTAAVGLPLELLGSQWLLCLFTTTFPSETVFRIFDCIFTEGSHFVFPVVIAHLRRLERALVGLEDFQAVLSAIKDAENVLLDADSFLLDVAQEADRIEGSRVAALREKHRESVRDEMQRAARAHALNRQLAVVYQIPAFSSYAASLLRFFHEEAEVSSRSDVAFVLTLLCHGLVWLAEHSKKLQR